MFWSYARRSLSLNACKSENLKAAWLSVEFGVSNVTRWNYDVWFINELAQVIFGETQLGEIRGAVRKELEHEFRKLAMENFGYGKGSLSKALEEALENWVNANHNAA